MGPDGQPMPGGQPGGAPGGPPNGAPSGPDQPGGSEDGDVQQFGPTGSTGGGGGQIQKKDGAGNHEGAAGLPGTDGGFVGASDKMKLSEDARAEVERFYLELQSGN